jgi:chromosome partitioning protein
MATVITVTLRKGGSGKTTTAVNLASSLAKHGKKVLLIDLDPQANATLSLGVDIVNTPNIADVLQGKHAIEHVINDPLKGFDLIPSNQILAQIEATLATDPSKYAQIIKSLLAPLLPRYDYILIDTPPSESMLTITALVASDYALIPTQAHYLAMHGLQQALDLITRVKEGYGANVEILGIVPTMVQTGTNIADMFIEQLKADYPTLLLPYPVPHSIKLTESQAMNEPITDYDPKHPASIAYMQLAKHITERGK